MTPKRRVGKFLASYAAHTTFFRLFSKLKFLIFKKFKLQNIDHISEPQELKNRSFKFRLKAFDHAPLSKNRSAPSFFLIVHHGVIRVDDLFTVVLTLIVLSLIGTG